MSKTITIPTNCNPYIVVINNHVYTYKAGEAVEVPDEVAEAIADALELVPEPKRYLSKFAQLVEGKSIELEASDLDGIGSISRYSFYECDNLKSVVVPKGVTSIGHSSFRNCSYLTRVEIPDGLLSVDARAFESCTSLERVIVRTLTPPSIQTDTFSSVPTTCVFEVPSEAVEAYKSAWSALANQIVAIKE